MNGPVMFAMDVLPESTMHTEWFTILAGFVAINTILYVSLSVFKIMPKMYLSDFVRRHGRRSETRSIYPDGLGPPAGLGSRDRADTSGHRLIAKVERKKGHGRTTVLRSPTRRRG